MHDTVIHIWIEFSKELEGYVNHMYLDIKGLVTIGIGNLIDPCSAALALPFIRKGDGALASQREIRFDWQTVKTRPELAKKGHRAAAKYTRLMLTESSIAKLVMQKLLSNEKILKQRFKHWDQWPADAQLAVSSHAWALGPSFSKKWPLLSQSLDNQNWKRAASQCQMREFDNPGVAPRNIINRQLFLAAHDTIERKLNLSIIYGLHQSEIT